ncbi:MAG: hypothetical protein ACXAC7_06295 [Candidatus Hodarchaeales archaeon]|jgi:hypothetical protein
MMDYERLILVAADSVRKELKSLIILEEIDIISGKIKINLSNGTIIYLRFNNYKQYTYVIQFSFRRLDRVRFDNFDDKWIVSTRPHHCHPLNRKDAIESIFTGDPEEDMPILGELVRSGKINDIV